MTGWLTAHVIKPLADWVWADIQRGIEGIEWEDEDCG